MRKKYNNDVRSFMKSKNVSQADLAIYFDQSDSKTFRDLRRPMSEQLKEKYLNAVDEISKSFEQ